MPSRGSGDIDPRSPQQRVFDSFLDDTAIGEELWNLADKVSIGEVTFEDAVSEIVPAIRRAEVPWTYVIVADKPGEDTYAVGPYASWTDADAAQVQERELLESEYKFGYTLMIVPIRGGKDAS
jgi:hypothetical protein